MRVRLISGSYTHLDVYKRQPQYRGAAPINWAVINGDTETGITTFFLKHEIDTGEIIQQVRVPIADTDNVEIVHDLSLIHI